MAWVKLDDQFHTDDKAVIAGLDGRALYIAGLCWCARNLTDGNIDKRALPAIAALAGVTSDIADTLVAIGLWEDQDVSYRVPGFLNYQPSRQQVVAEREAAAERQRRSREKSRRDSQGTNGVTSAAPSPSPEDLSLVSPSSDLHRAVDNRTDDEVPAETWDQYAQIKLGQQPAGKVKSRTKWLAAARANARTEHGETALHWWRTFDVRPRDLAAWLIDGKPSPYAKRRAEAS